MKEEEIEQIRQKLLALRSALQELEETFKETSKPVALDQARVGRLPRMDAMQAHEMALEAFRRRQHQLTRIEGAMRRIETDEYGCCFACSEEIDVRRLFVDPANTRCIACAEK